MREKHIDPDTRRDRFIKTEGGPKESSRDLSVWEHEPRDHHVVEIDGSAETVVSVRGGVEILIKPLEEDAEMGQYDFMVVALRNGEFNGGSLLGSGHLEIAPEEYIGMLKCSEGDLGDVPRIQWQPDGVLRVSEGNEPMQIREMSLGSS